MLRIRAHLSPDALFQEIAGEAVILDLATSTYFGLDPVGARVWQLLQEQTDLQRVCARLLDEFDVTQERLEEDVLRLLQELKDAGLVQLESGAEPQ